LSRSATTLGVLAVTLLLSAPAHAQKLRKYTVQPGDSCWSIAQSIFGKGAAYKVIHRHNQLGPLPHVLVPGQVLRLPLKASPYEAKVNWLRRKVQTKAPRSVDWKRARDDMGLWRLHKVSTGDASSAGIVFEDTSHLGMKQNALLVIYGAARTSKLGRRARGRVVLEKGTVRGGLGALDAASGGSKTSKPGPTAPPVADRPPPPPLRIDTPAGKVQLASSDAQVEVDETRASRVSVFEGKADVTAQGTRVTVPEGHGSVVKMGKKPSKPTKLPARPRWKSGTGTSVILVPQGAQGVFEAHWDRVGGARRYRVEWAKDKRFREIVTEAVVGAGVRRFRVEGIEPGTYWARASAIDANRLQGKSSKKIQVDVVQVATSRRLGTGKDGVLEAVGMLRVVVPANEGTLLSLDDAAFAPVTSAIRLSKPGTYALRTRRGKGPVSSMRVRILGVTGVLKSAGDTVKPGETATFELSVLDEHKRPAALPGLSVQVAGLGAARLTPTGPGAARVEVDVPASWSWSAVSVRAAWAGGVLNDTELAVQHAIAPVVPTPPPPTFSWHAVPAAPWTPSAGRVPLARSARPDPRVGLRAGFITPTGSDPAFATTLGGELTLGPVLLDAWLPWIEDVAGVDSAGTNDLGDLRFALRAAALQRERLAVAAGLTVIAPTGRGPALTTFAPGAQLDWNVGPITLNTNQALTVDTDFGDTLALGWAGTWAATWRAVHWLDLGVQIDTAAGITGHSGPDFAVGAGGAVTFNIGRVRLGASGSGPLTSDSEQRLGKFSAMFSAEIGFGHLLQDAPRD
jgi:hypothetical protein